MFYPESVSLFWEVKIRRLTLVCTTPFPSYRYPVITLDLSVSVSQTSLLRTVRQPPTYSRYILFCKGSSTHHCAESLYIFGNHRTAWNSNHFLESLLFCSCWGYNKNSLLVLTQTLKGLNIWLFSLVYAAETGAQFSVMCTQLEKRLFLKIW